MPGSLQYCGRDPPSQNQDRKTTKDEGPVLAVGPGFWSLHLSVRILREVGLLLLGVCMLLLLERRG